MSDYVTGFWITTVIVPSPLTNSNTNNRVSASSLSALDSNLFVLHIITILSSTFIFSQTVFCCIVCMCSSEIFSLFLLNSICLYHPSLFRDIQGTKYGLLLGKIFNHYLAFTFPITLLQVSKFLKVVFN